MNSMMDMKISGSGKIPAGEYQQVSTHGSGRLFGLVRCTTFHASGSTKGEQLECAEMLRASGSTSFSGDVKAGDAAISGSFSCGGRFFSDGEIRTSGSTKCKGLVKCDTLSISGTLTAGGDVEAEAVTVRGCINCTGLINAEQVDIRFGNGMKIGSVGGSRIAILSRKISGFFKSLPLISRLSKTSFTCVIVANVIEGDVVELEHVTCPRVTGRTVSIGRGCYIDLVQYSGEIKIARGAKVGKVEKI